ncbi:hypothetical protein SAMN05877809_105289 [Rhodobacter sp. JA431]|uniref:phage tail tube protein n=1 Tax=Rhodobacter sp. JA431 TaxID=570013 RepID=UPI000BC43415|nr:phage tail tube protein [Rhodobacter sp. JA431]SOC11451.1 hypothetical protein SAMN05877809_105289 [Rhodobacter sp. JA431]
MVEAASQADIGYQDELWIGRTVDATTTFTQILGVEELSVPERAPDDIEVTHMQSPGRSRETIPGLLSVADWSQDLQYWPEHASQVLLETLAGLTEAGTWEEVYVEFVVAGIRRTYRGYVNSWTPQSSVGDKRMASLSMKIFNRVTPDPRALS